MTRCDPELLRRITGLPRESAARFDVLRLFSCYSIGTALLLLQGSEGEERERYEQALWDILESAGERSPSPGAKS